MTEPTFDPRRKAAIRDLIVQNAATRGRVLGRKRTAFVVTLVLLAVGISGGGVAYALGTGLIDPAPVAAPSPTATPAPTATPTPTPTATPTPTPTPTSTMDPADPSTWTIGFDGVGPVTLGPTPAEQRATLPAFSDETEPICVDELATLTSPAGLRFTFVLAADGSGRTAAIEFGNLGTSGADDRASTPRTTQGIGVGSTLDELLTAYPGIAQTSSYNGSSFTYALTDGRGRWIAFMLINDVVTDIQLADTGMLPRGQGRADSIPSERCPA